MHAIWTDLVRCVQGAWTKLGTRPQINIDQKNDSDGNDDNDDDDGRDDDNDSCNYGDRNDNEDDDGGDCTNGNCDDDDDDVLVSPHLCSLLQLGDWWNCLKTFRDCPPNQSSVSGSSLNEIFCD